MIIRSEPQTGTDTVTGLVSGTLTALGGSLLAPALAPGLVDTFKGKELVPDAVIADTRFLLAVGLAVHMVCSSD